MPGRAAVPTIKSGTVTADFRLDALPSRKVSGVVRDGSGHGWPLYARIEVAGKPGGPIFTDPATGTYSVDLPQGEYGLTVRAMYPSYQNGTAQVTVDAADQVKNFALPVENTCLAAGYTTNYCAPLLREEFDSGITPEGWTVVNRTANGGWVFTDPRNRGNLTGGTGRYAIIDNAGSGRPVDTDLVSPPLDFSSVAAPVLLFNSDYRAWSNGSADVDVSVDGGSTWTNLSRWTTVDRRGQAGGEGHHRGQRRRCQGRRRFLLDVLHADRRAPVQRGERPLRVGHEHGQRGGIPGHPGGLHPKAGRLTITPAPVAANVPLGQTKTTQMTIRNDGNAPVTSRCSARAGHVCRSTGSRAAACHPRGGARRSASRWNPPRTVPRGPIRRSIRSW
ncbi:MAG TPA: hypothetical protein VFX60_17445 [Micromonospora sp.]|nr:hypothetical protein [Micromonospora sp.]